MLLLLLLLQLMSHANSPVCKRHCKFVSMPNYKQIKNNALLPFRLGLNTPSRVGGKVFVHATFRCLMPQRARAAVVATLRLPARRFFHIGG